MKKKLLLLLMLLFISLPITAKAETKQTDVYLIKNSITLIKGSTVNVPVKLQSEDDSFTLKSFSSGNTSIVKITTAKQIYAKGVGTTYVYVNSFLHDSPVGPMKVKLSKPLKLKVTVVNKGNKKDVPLSKIYDNKKNIQLTVESVTGVSGVKTTFTSGDTSIAKVDSNGYITVQNKKGSTTVKASIIYTKAGQKYKTTYSIKVNGNTSTCSHDWIEIERKHVDAVYQRVYVWHGKEFEWYNTCPKCGTVGVKSDPKCGCTRVRYQKTFKELKPDRFELDKDWCGVDEENEEHYLITRYCPKCDKVEVYKEFVK